MLLDKNSKYFLDLPKLRKSAKKYTITREFTSICISNFCKQKKINNMYTKFFTMASQNTALAIDWINKSIKERVKLTAAETVFHQGSVV